MDIDLMCVEETRCRILSRIESRAWWTIVSFDPLGARLMNEIEGRFYSGEAGADFELAIIPPGALFPDNPLTGIGLARKNRMTATELADLLADLGAPVPVWELRHNDILCPQPAGEPNAMVVMIHRWLYRPDMN